MDLTRRPKGPFGIADKAHALQAGLAKLWGRPTSAMRTDLERGGQPVIFLHNPKTGGKSLREFLHVQRDSHAYASQRLSERSWLGTYSVVAVRDPFERFLSNYYDRILKGNRNAFVKLYGPEVLSVDPFGFLEILRDNPIFGGPQTLWTDFPSPAKPRADLVLRFESIDRWKEQMIAAGLAVHDRAFPHRNPSARAHSDHLESLSLTRPEFDRLEAEVREAFRADYDAFGYD
jgi:hypothetical protein